MNVLSIVITGVVLFMMTFKPLETSVGMETNLPIEVWENPLLNTIPAILPANKQPYLR